ncbi:hypothetical protein [Pelagerythrobacter aerophilus]
MLKYAEAPQKPVPIAKPRRKPIDIDAGFDRVMSRYPKIMARLAE